MPYRKVFCIAAFAMAACASEYGRRMPVADDPSNPDAEPTPRGPEVVLADPLPRDAVVEPAPATTGPHSNPTSPSPAKALVGPVYTCPMHSEVQLPSPGNCPKCGMKLLVKNAPDAGRNGAHDMASMSGMDMGDPQPDGGRQ